MSSPVSSRKRKADALEADGSAGDSPESKRKSDSSAHLPAPCLAAVLNFMRYTDVRQCMLAGKMMAVEAARHVEALNITKASELVVPAARRFGNASEVNVLCLVSPIDEDDGADSDDRISMDTVRRIVPFLTSIPNLERVFLGGLYHTVIEYYTSQGHRHTEDTVWYRYEYFFESCTDPNDHQVIFKTLIQNLIGAFQTKSLPQSLELDGILESGQLECTDNGTVEDPDNPCQFCRQMLSSFPLHLLLNPVAHYRTFCVSHVDRIRTLLLRDGAEAALRSSGGVDMLLSCLDNAIPHTVFQSSKSEVDEAFLKRMKDQGARAFVTNPANLSIKWHRNKDSFFNDFFDLVNGTSLLQDVIKGIPRSRLLGKYSFKASAIFARQSFETLLGAGLQLDASDYIIVDPEKEPALARYL